MGMSLPDFMEFCQGFDQQCNEVLGIANREYAAGDNKFYNFDMIASLMSCGEKEFTPHDIASVYFMKHAMSIIRGVSEREDMSGRYMDAVNYLKLMAGMHEEERHLRENDHPSIVRLTQE
jgi:hypothetical protein